MYSALEVFVYLFLFRYIRLIINVISHWTFKPIPPPDDPTYTSQDVTVIIPSITGDGDELRETIRGCLNANPFEVILVTVDANLKRAYAMAAAIHSKKIRVLSVTQANKRRQMSRAIPEVLTSITVFADDDVIWPPKVLKWMLAPFEDPKMGGVGTNQSLRRGENLSFTGWVWDYLGSIYLRRRNFDISACTHMDGGLPCLSGRTVAYRTHILQDPDFTFDFTNETWRSYQLNADDDNFITRWMVSHHWKTYVQYHKECEVQTTLERGPKYIKQCLRWLRSNWRSNLTSMFVERGVWRQQPWSTYAVQQTTLTGWPLLIDSALVCLCWRITRPYTLDEKVFYRGLLIAWIIFSKIVKNLEHYVRYPVDLLLLPIGIGFAYLHGSVLKLYALFTLDVTAWGSRDGADNDDASRMIRIHPGAGSSSLRKAMAY
ncbi:polysaccharide synthase Cps1 [Cryomyces antarcticus]